MPPPLPPPDVGTESAAHYLDHTFRGQLCRPSAKRYILRVSAPAGQFIVHPAHPLHELLRADRQRTGLHDPLEVAVGFGDADLDELAVFGRALGLGFGVGHREHRRVVDECQPRRPADVAAVAAPAILAEHVDPLAQGELFRRASSHRVKVDVSRQAEDVRVAPNHAGTEAALEEVPAALVAAVEVDAVRGLEAVHEVAEIARRRLDHQVDVIGHQAEHVQANVMGLDAVSQAVEKPLAVAVVEEDVPPIIPANGDVIDSAFIFNS